MLFDIKKSVKFLFIEVSLLCIIQYFYSLVFKSVDCCGISVDLSEEQFAKAFSPINLTDDGTDICDNDEHP